MGDVRPIELRVIREIEKMVARIGKPYISGSSGKAGYSYLPLPFKGLGHIPNHRPDSYERWDAISKEVDFKGRHVVDLGCATGFFCFKAAFAGARVVGVEYDDKAFVVAERLKELFGFNSLDFILGNVREHLDKVSDIVFAMSILHWIRIAGGDGLMESFVREIQARSKLLFVEIPIKGSGGAGVLWMEKQETVGSYLRSLNFLNVKPIAKVSSHAGERWTWVAEGGKK